MGPRAESRCNGPSAENGLDRSERPVELATSSKSSLDASQVIDGRSKGHNTRRSTSDILPFCIEF